MMPWENACYSELWDAICVVGDGEIMTHFSSGGGKGWICTRPEGHSGNHVGGSGSKSDDPKQDYKWIEWNDNEVVAYQIAYGDVTDYGIPLSSLPAPFIVQELY